MQVVRLYVTTSEPSVACLAEELPKGSLLANTANGDWAIVMQQHDELLEDIERGTLWPNLVIEDHKLFFIAKAADMDRPKATYYQDLALVRKVLVRSIDSARR